MKNMLRKALFFLLFGLFCCNQLWADGGNGVNIIRPAADTNVCPGDSLTLIAENTGYTSPGAFTLADDSYSGVIPIGFNFNFYGNTYNKCLISSNGYICFDTTLANATSAWAIGTSVGGPGGVPGNSNVSNSIMGVYSDLFFPAGGNIKYGVAGVSPNRRFVVTFCTSPLYSCTSLNSSFQIILYETSNIAEVHIRRVDTCHAWNEAAAIVGVQNATATAATVATGHTYPGAWAVTTPEGNRFTPDATFSSYTYNSIPYNPIAEDSSTIRWFAGTTFLGTGTTMPVLVSASTTYRAIAVTCSDTSFSTRTVSTTPVTVGPISGPDTVCVGTTINLTDSVSGGSWLTISPNFTVSSSGLITGVSVGYGIVYYYIYNSCGGDTVSKTIYVDLPANAGRVTGANTLCRGTSTTLSTTGTGGVWSSTNPAVATVNASGQVTAISLGTTIISYTARNGCGPVADTQLITVSTHPAVGAITGTNTVCTGNTTALIDTPSGGTWTSGSAGVASVSTAGVVTGISAGTAIITYNLTNACGTAQDTIVITVIQTPATGPITGPATVCLSSNIILADTSAGGSWSSTAPATATVSSTGVVTGLALGSATISYTVINSCGTSGVAKVVSVVNGTGSAGPIIGPSSVCIGASITMSDTPSGGTWSNAFPALSSVNPVTGVVTGLSSGIDTIIYSVAAGCGNARATKIISVNTVPVVTPISGPTAVCAGGTITLTDASSGGSWSTVYPSIASVNSVGVVNGITAGVDTIKYTVSNTCGSTAATYVVTVNTSGISPISGPNTICAGATITLTDPTTGGTWSSLSPAVASVSTSGVVSGLSAGTAVISYTVINACGTQAATQTVTVNPAPNAGTLSGPTVVCVGATITINTTGSGGTFASQSPSIATVNGSTGLVTGLATGTDSIIYTTTNSCGTARAAYGITINPAAASGTVTGANSLCAGTTTTLTTTGTGGSWSTTNASVASVSNTGVVNGTSAGNAIISYTVTNSCGTIADTQAITVNPLPNAGAVSGPTALCIGNTSTFTTTGTGGTWSSGNAARASVNSATGAVTGTGAGAVIISYTATNGCGTATDTIQIIVSPAPATGVISSARAVCVNATTLFTTTGTGGTWTTANPTIASINSTGTVTGLTTGTALISYTVTTGCGSASDTQAITVNPLPNAGTISGATSFCPGSTITLTSTVTGGTWSSTTPAVATINSGTGVATGITSGTSLISYSFTNTCGTDVDTATITVSPGATAGSISGPSTVCRGSSITLTDGVTGGTWSSNNTGVATVTPAGGVVTGVAVGSVIISYVVTTTCGTAATSDTITVTPGTVVGAISGPTSVCAGNTILLSDTSAGGTWSSSNPAVATVTNTGSVTGLTSGTTAISYTITGICGPVSVAVPVTVNVAPSTAGTISGPATLCTGVSASFSSTISGGVWATRTPTVASINNATGLATGVTTGTATIVYTISNSCGAAADSTTITVNTAPSAGVITGPTTVCAGNTITLSDTATGGTWSSTNSAIASVSNTGVVTGIAGGTTVISYTITSSCGPVAATASVTVNPAPDAGTISGSGSVCISNSTPLTTTGTTGGSWVATNSNATVSASGLVGGLASGLDTIYYIVTNSCGTDSASHIVNVGTPASAGTITGPSTVCAGSSIVLSNTTTGGSWISSNNTIASVNSTGTVFGLTSGSVTITYILSSSCGSSLTTAPVTVNPTAVAGIISGSSPLCAGASAAYTTTGTGGNWTTSNSAVASVNTTGTVTAISAGVAIISYAVTNSCGTATDTQAVRVNSTPDAGTISGVTPLCPAASTTLSTTGSGGTWSSSNPTVASVNAATGVVTGISAGAATISYIVTSASCGNDTATAAVTVNTTATAGTLSGPSTVCTGATITLSSTVAGGTWTSTNPAVASVSTTGVVSGITTGTATISYSVSGTCGSAATSTSVSVTPAPNAGTVSGPSSLCPGASASFTTTGTSGTWSSSNTAVASVNSATGAVTAISAGSVNITYTSTTSCGSAFATAPLTVNPAGTSGTISGPSIVCTGATITLATTGTGGTWSSTNTSVASVSNTGVVNGIATGTTTISYTTTGTCGTVAATYTVNVSNTASAGVISGPTNYCIGTPAGLSSTVAGGTWTSNNPAIASINSITGAVTPLTAGSTTITYTVTTTCSSAFGTYNITVGGSSSAGTISGPTAVCTGSAVSLTTTGTGGTWSTGNAAIASVDGSGNVTGVGTGTTSISYSVTGSCGTATATHSMNVSTAPNAGTISGTSPLCAGTSALFTTTGTGGNWTSSNGSIASVDASGNVTAIAAGSTIISYSAATSCSTAVASFPLTVSPAATAGTLSGASSVCVGASTVFSSTATGGTWTTADATIASVNSATGSVTGVASGTTTITYTNTNSCGTATATRTISVNPLAAPGTISGTTSVCIGATTVLSSTGTGGTWSTTDPTVATVSNAGIVTGRSAGTAIISYSVTNGCGTVAATTTVNVLPFPSAGTILGPGTACIGTAVTYVDTTTGGIWSSGDTSIATVNASGSVTGISSGTVNIYYTVTNTCGSTNVTISVNITNAPATSVITGFTTICPGGTTTLTDTTLGGTWSSSDNSIATVVPTSATTASVTGVAGGTAIISYTLSNACGTSVATAYVTVTPLPTATITGPSSLCPGNTATLIPSITGGTWSSTDTTIATIGTTGLVTAIRSGSAVLSYTIAGTCGIATVTDTIIITPATTAGTITGFTAACIATTTTLTDSITGGTWTSSNTAVATVSNTGVVTGITPGTTTITYTVGGACGSAFTTATVTIYSLPDPGFITGVTTLCAGVTDTFTETIPGGAWSTSNAAIASVNATGTASAAVTGVSGGTAIISYSITGLCGTGIATAFVTITPAPPTGAITGTTTICTGTTSTLADSVSGGTWSSADTSIAIVSSTGVVTARTAGTTTISYTVTGTCGAASATTAFTVAAPSAPATLSGVSALCPGSTATVSASIAGGTWMSSDSTVATVNASTGMVTARNTGFFTLSYTTSGGAGCTSTATAVDTVLSATAGILTAPTTTACTGGTFVITPSISGGTWAIRDTAIATVSGGTVTGRTAGTTTVTYTVTNSRGCTASVTVDVTINPRPATPTISGSSSLCAGTSIALSADVTGGAWSSSAATVASVDTVGTVSGISAGTAVISYTITNSLGCTATATHADTIWGAATTPTITAPGRLCAGGTVTLSASVTGGTWSTSAASIASVTAATGVLNALAPGTVSINYVIGATGCSATASATITIDSLPTPPTITGTTAVCAGSAATYTATPTGGVWSVTDTTVATINSIGVLTTRTPGSIIVAYIITNAAGCSATDTAMVNVLTAPTAAITPATGAVICHGAPVTLSIAPAGMASVQWYLNGSAIAGATSATYNADTVGVYTAVVSNGSCSATLTGVTVTNSARPVISRAGSTLSTATYATYQWYRNGVAITGATGRTYNYSSSGSYIVVITTASGCRDTSAAYVINTTGIAQVSAADISLYPNPATSVIRIDAPFTVRVTVFTADGRKVIDANETNTVDVSNLTSGMYMITIYTTTGEFIKVDKFMKQ